MFKFLSKFKFWYDKHDTKKNMPVLCYRCYGFGQNDILPILDFHDSNSSYLTDQLSIKPNTYKIKDYLFELKDNGLYRFYALNEINEQRLVISDTTILSILKSLGHLWDYGSQDNNLDKQKLKRTILQRKVILGCSNLSFLCLDILHEMNIRCRVVSVLTMEERNQIDDGHTLIEIFDPNSGWFLYDPSFKCIFKIKNENLSLLKLIARIKNAQHYEIVFLSAISTNSFKSSSYDFSFWVEHRLNSETQLRKWYARMFQIPLIYFSKKFYCTGDKQTIDSVNRSMKHSENYYNYLKYDDFMKLFYD